MNNQCYFSGDPSTIASEILRRHWGLELPIRVDLIAHRMGVLLFPQDMPSAFSGHFYSETDPDNKSKRPAIIFNSKDPTVRQRFTIAHELGHYVLGHGTSPRDAFDDSMRKTKSPRERAANLFAAHLLMPPTLVKLSLSQGIKTVDSLAKQYGVSRAAMSFHLINIGLGEPT